MVQRKAGRAVVSELVARLLIRSALLAATLALGGCFYPTTYFRASADEGAYPRAHCPGREEHWVQERDEVRMETTVGTKESAFHVLMYLRAPQPVSARLQDVQIRVADRTYSAEVANRFLVPCTPFCRSVFEPIPESGLLDPGGYVVVFPRELGDLERMTVLYPPFLVRGKPVMFAPVTFTKTNELRYFTINC